MEISVIHIKAKATSVLLKMDSEKKKASTTKAYSLKDLYFGCMVTIHLCL